MATTMPTYERDLRRMMDQMQESNLRNTMMYQYWGGHRGGGGGTSNRNHDGAVERAMTEVKKSVVTVAKEVNKEAATKRGELLKELGFTKLHKAVRDVAERATKENLAILAGYKKIPYVKFKEADTRLRSDTAHDKTLALTPVGEYMGQHHGGVGENPSEPTLPPTDVLEKMSTAKKENLFDDFAVIHVVRGPDPILVGTIKGTKDLFYIAEWGNDIKLADIID